MKLTPEMKRLMSPSDQARYFGTGNGFAPDPIKQGKEALRLEREEQRTFANWLSLQKNEGRLSFDWSRTDRAVTCVTGMPDFKIYGENGRTLFIEMKTQEGRLSPDQYNEFGRLLALGHPVQVALSAAAAIRLVKHWLGE